MSNSISKSAKGSKNVRNNQSVKLVAISATQNSPKRVLETRDQWENIFSHTVFLIVSYFKGQQPKGPRKGYAFGKALECPHERAYAQSLLAGFVTNKAGKALKGSSELSDAASRSKIVTTILLDTCLAKGGVEGAQSMIERSQPKREKALALAVLNELQKQEPKGLPYYPEVTATTPKSGSSKGKGNKTQSATKTKATTPKGGSSKAQPKAEKATTKGGKTASTPKSGSKKSSTAKRTTLKGYTLSAEEQKLCKKVFDEWVANDEVEDWDDDRTITEVIDEAAEYLGFEEFDTPQYQAVDDYISQLGKPRKSTRK